MPLDHVDRPGYEDKQGVHFPMMHNVTSVRVLVTRKAIQGASPSPEDGDYLARFEANRELFEIIARDKFEPDEPTAKITITPDDLLGEFISGGHI
jgi:Protein of unknown function (DUF1488)